MANFFDAWHPNARDVMRFNVFLTFQSENFSTKHDKVIVDAGEKKMKWSTSDRDGPEKRGKGGEQRRSEEAKARDVK